jgi:hypothetical protein
VWCDDDPDGSPDYTKLSDRLEQRLLRRGLLPVPPPPQWQPDGDTSHNDNNSNVDRILDDSVVYEKLERALVPFFNEAVLNKLLQPLGLVGREFHRIAMELLRCANRRRDRPSRFIPFALPWVTPDPIRDKNKLFRWSDYQVVYIQLRSALVPFFEEVLLGTFLPPFRILAGAFNKLAICLLRVDNGHFGDGLEKRSYHMIPFPSGDIPSSFGLPPLYNEQCILDLGEDDVLRYYSLYRPSSGGLNTVEEARKGIAVSIRARHD